MIWTHAIAEMVKDNSKVFKGNFCYWKVNSDGELIKSNCGGPESWRLADVTKQDRLDAWVEVEILWRELNYSDFMAWYCEPLNTGKQYEYFPGANGDWIGHTNNHDFSPCLFMNKKKFRVKVVTK